MTGPHRSLIAVITLVLSAGSHAEPPALSAMPIGQPPAGFEFARTGAGAMGAWTVVKDESAVGGRAIAQTSADPTDYRFPLAIVPGVIARNGRSVRRNGAWS